MLTGNLIIGWSELTVLIIVLILGFTFLNWRMNRQFEEYDTTRSDLQQLHEELETHNTRLVNRNIELESENKVLREQLEKLEQIVYPPESE